MPRYNLFVPNTNSPGCQEVLRKLARLEPEKLLYPIHQGRCQDSFYTLDEAQGIPACLIIPQLGRSWDKNISLYIQEQPN